MDTGESVSYPGLRIFSVEQARAFVTEHPDMIAGYTVMSLRQFKRSFDGQQLHPYGRIGNDSMNVTLTTGAYVECFGEMPPTRHMTPLESMESNQDYVTPRLISEVLSDLGFPVDYFSVFEQYRYLIEDLTNDVYSLVQSLLAGNINHVFEIFEEFSSRLPTGDVFNMFFPDLQKFLVFLEAFSKRGGVQVIYVDRQQFILYLRNHGVKKVDDDGATTTSAIPARFMILVPLGQYEQERLGI